jgi:hypothetical protein
VPAHAVAPAEEARSEHVVRPPARDRPEHPLKVTLVVLTVPIEIDRGGVPVVTSQLEARAKRGAEATRHGMRMDPRTLLACDLGRAVARAVVDDDHVDVQPARPARDARNDSTDGSLLVPGNHDREAPTAGLCTGCRA